METSSSTAKFARRAVNSSDILDDWAGKMLFTHSQKSISIFYNLINRSKLSRIINFHLSVVVP